MTSPATFKVECNNSAGNVGSSLPVYVTISGGKPVCTNATPDGDSIKDTVTSRTVSVNGVANATAVKVAAYKDASKIIWLTATQSGTTWSANITTSSFGTTVASTPITVNTYMTNSSFSQEPCDTANFNILKTGKITINVDPGISWTLTGPAGEGTSGTGPTPTPLTGKLYGTYTLTPQNKPGFSATISPSNGTVELK